MNAGVRLRVYCAERELESVRCRPCEERDKQRRRLDFLPLGSPIPRGTKKVASGVLRGRSGPQAGAASFVPGRSIAIEAAMVAGSKSTGELTWLTSVRSRKSATALKAKSSCRPSPPRRARRQARPAQRQQEGAHPSHLCGPLGDRLRLAQDHRR